MAGEEVLQYTSIGPVVEGGVGTYRGTLTQGDGVTPVPGSALTLFQLTLIDLETGAVINSRDAQDVLNANNVTVDMTTGDIAWTMRPDDSPFLRKSPPPSEGDLETHQAIFEWHWFDTDGELVGKKKVFIVVEKYLGPTSPTGDGSAEYADTLLAADGVTPIDDATVWVTSDAGGDTLVAGPQQTDTAGAFSFMLDPGTYYLWVKHPSYTFDVQTITVS